MGQPLSITVDSFGEIENKKVLLYHLSNDSIEVKLTNYGCSIVSVVTPDKTGHRENIVAGFDNFNQYKQDHPYFGCVIGRYANRIA